MRKKVRIDSNRGKAGSGSKKKDEGGGGKGECFEMPDKAWHEGGGKSSLSTWMRPMSHFGFASLGRIEGGRKFMWRIKARWRGEKPRDFHGGGGTWGNDQAVTKEKRNDLQGRSITEKKLET